MSVEDLIQELSKVKNKSLPINLELVWDMEDDELPPLTDVCICSSEEIEKEIKLIFSK